MANAVPFMPGNLVIYRTGVASDGSSPTSAPDAVFIDEYTTAALQTLPVQSFAMPTTDGGVGNNRALTAQGNATLEGLLHRSTDGQYVVFTGYNHTLGNSIAGGAATLAVSDAVDVNRTIGRIDGLGTFATTTLVNDSGTGSPRSAVSDNGVNLWLGMGSVGSDSTPDGGVRYTTHGTAGASTMISPSTANFDPRGINIFNGQLYVSAQSIATGTTTDSAVAAVGTGLPTTSASNVGLVGVAGGSGPNIVEFFLADLSTNVAGVDTLYVTGDASGRITKYSLVGSTWTSNGVIASGATNTYRGLAGEVKDVAGVPTVFLYSTRGAGSQLVSLTDASGYNSGAGIFAALTPVLLATAQTNTLFKGVTFAPIAVPEAGSAILLGLIGCMCGLAVWVRRRAGNREQSAA